MRATIAIELTEPDPELVHRFQNLGEDVYRALREMCSVDIDEIDRATSRFSVREIRPRDIGRASQALERLVRRHDFEGSVRLVRLDRQES
ncbi:MAG TPA: hypothetical protein VF613_18015 [Longimicrobium sp.]|jgi:hypothetical protein